MIIDKNFSEKLIVISLPVATHSYIVVMWAVFSNHMGIFGRERMFSQRTSNYIQQQYKIGLHFFSKCNQSKNKYT